MAHFVNGWKRAARERRRRAVRLAGGGPDAAEMKDDIDRFVDNVLPVLPEGEAATAVDEAFWKGLEEGEGAVDPAALEEQTQALFSAYGRMAAEKQRLDKEAATVRGLHEANEALAELLRGKKSVLERAISLFGTTKGLAYWRDDVDEEAREERIAKARPTLGANDPTKDINVHTLYPDQAPPASEDDLEAWKAFAEAAAGAAKKTKAFQGALDAARARWGRASEKGKAWAAGMADARAKAREASAEARPVLALAAKLRHLFRANSPAFAREGLSEAAVAELSARVEGFAEAWAAGEATARAALDWGERATAWAEGDPGADDLRFRAALEAARTPTAPAWSLPAKSTDDFAALQKANESALAAATQAVEAATASEPPLSAPPEGYEALATPEAALRLEDLGGLVRVIAKGVDRRLADTGTPEPRRTVSEASGRRLEAGGRSFGPFHQVQLPEGATNPTNGGLREGLRSTLVGLEEGRTVTTLAYGHSGSGKTHSMFSSAPEDEGLVRRCLRGWADRLARVDAYVREVYGEARSASVAGLSAMGGSVLEYARPGDVRSVHFKGAPVAGARCVGRVPADAAFGPGNDLEVVETVSGIAASLVPPTHPMHGLHTDVVGEGPARVGDVCRRGAEYAVCLAEGSVRPFHWEAGLANSEARPVVTPADVAEAAVPAAQYKFTSFNGSVKRFLEGQPVLLGSNEAYANGVLAVTGTFGYATEYPAEEDKGEVLYVVTPEPTLDLDRDGSNFFVVKDGKMYRHRQEWCVRRGLELCNYLDPAEHDGALYAKDFDRAVPGRPYALRSKGWAHWTYQGEVAGRHAFLGPAEPADGWERVLRPEECALADKFYRLWGEGDGDGPVAAFQALYDRVEAVRRANGRIAPTANNAASSRSHLFLTLRLGFKGGKTGTWTVADLAGSEDPYRVAEGFQANDWAESFRWDPTNSEGLLDGAQWRTVRQAFFVNETNHHAMAFCRKRDPQVGTVNVEHGAMDLGPRETYDDEVQDGEGVKRHSLTKRLAETANELYMLRLYEKGRPGNGASIVLPFARDNKGAMHVGPFSGSKGWLSTASYLVVQGGARVRGGEVFAELLDESSEFHKFLRYDPRRFAQNPVAMVHDARTVGVPEKKFEAFLISGEESSTGSSEATSKNDEHGLGMGDLDWAAMRDPKGAWDAANAHAKQRWNEWNVGGRNGKEPLRGTIPMVPVLEALAKAGRVVLLQHFRVEGGRSTEAALATLAYSDEVNPMSEASAKALRSGQEKAGACDLQEEVGCEPVKVTVDGREAEAAKFLPTLAGPWGAVETVDGERIEGNVSLAAEKYGPMVSTWDEACFAPPSYHQEEYIAGSVAQEEEGSMGSGATSEWETAAASCLSGDLLRMEDLAD